MIILGLSINHPNSSATFVVNGKVVFAAEEERFDKIKNSSKFPVDSILKGLEHLNISIDQIDAIAINKSPYYNLFFKLLFLFKFIFSTKYFLNMKSFIFSQSFKKNFFTTSNSSYILKKMYEKNFYYIPHHLTHVANGFFSSGFDSALCYSYDGSGDFSCIESYIAKKNNFKIVKKITFPNSLGIFYQMFTQLAGFTNHGDEYKFMALAALGKPVYMEKLKKVVSYDGEKIFLNQRYLNFTSIFNYSEKKNTDNLIFNQNLVNLFCLQNEKKSKDKIQNIATSVQKVFEKIIICHLNFLHDKYKNKNLVLSGGCAFNAVANQKILEKTKFKNIYIGSNPGDAGGSAGAALYLASKLERKFVKSRLNNSFFGPEYSNDYISKMLNSCQKKESYQKIYFNNFDRLSTFVAEKLLKNNIVGWFQDRMEFGARALGNRSILARPDILENKKKLNKVIKNREKFRPFAASIMYEFQKLFFVNSTYSPFMNYTLDIKKNKRNYFSASSHFDGTCRVQSVKKNHNLKFYKLIKAFYKKTKIPFLLNTSLNAQEPICENPESALKLFNSGKLDILVLQNWVLIKKY